MEPKKILSLAVLLFGALAVGESNAQYRHHPHHAHGHRYWAAPVYRYAPRWWWAPVYPYFYGATVYAPPVYAVPAYRPPIIVEREVVRPRQYSYEERSYAQIQPQAPRPVEPARPAPAPAPRLERYTLSATELFEFDKATLKPRQPRLDEIAAALVRNPEIGNVRVTGYTDRLGSEEYNLKLSQRRAQAVASYLVKKGVDANRLQVVGKGEANPVVQCSDKEHKSQAALIKCLEPNRRVEVEQITIERVR
jgi:outer membrane protein OmpA-like peptidoglycan-associated protein